MSNPQEPITSTNSESVDYKAQLDDLATKARQPPQSPEDQEPNKPEGTGAIIVDKVSQIIPAVKKVLGGGGNEEEVQQQQRDTSPDKTDKTPAGGPQRPHHDPHIAEFLRDQHKSIEITKVDE